MTTVTISNQYGTYSVTVEDEDLALGELIERCVIPALRSAGYMEETIGKYFYAGQPNDGA